MFYIENFRINKEEHQLRWKCNWKTTNESISDQALDTAQENMQRDIFMGMEL